MDKTVSVWFTALTILSKKLLKTGFMSRWPERGAKDKNKVIISHTIINEAIIHTLYIILYMYNGIMSLPLFHHLGVNVRLTLTGARVDLLGFGATIVAIDHLVECHFMRCHATARLEWYCLRENEGVEREGNDEGEG